MAFIMMILCFLVWAVCSAIDTYVTRRRREYWLKNPPEDPYKEVNDELRRRCDEANRRLAEAKQQYKAEGKEWPTKR